MSDLGDPGIAAEGQFQTLRPGETYKKSLEYPLKDDLVRKKGEYEIYLAYGQFRSRTAGGVKLLVGTVTSNRVRFRIADCKD
jgi:hypothetical protein